MDLFKVDIPDTKLGNWSIQKFTVEENSPHRVYYALHGRPVPAGTYTRLLRGKSTIMSDTPAEIRDHLSPYLYAKDIGGRILINGLGLGCILKAVLSCENVTHVDVVELDEDVIDMVAPYYMDSRVEIHHANALEMTWPKGTRWNIAWHDIWDSICVDNLEEMGKLHRKYGHRVIWQGSWCKQECLRERRKALPF